MDALGGGEVQGKLSAVATLSSLRAKPQEPGGEDLADLGQALGRGHQIGVEAVRASHGCALLLLFQLST
jgi:hypothetical protein